MDIIKFYEKKIGEAEQAFTQFPWESVEAYSYWLAQTFHYVSHSTRLLVLAASRFSLEKNKLHYRFIQHAKEESGHENLASRDLVDLHMKVEELPEFGSTKAFYQTQYYWIEHVSPLAFFGYILFLEGLAVSKGDVAYEQVVKHHGQKPSRFLKVHAGEDPDHLKKAFSFLTDLSSAEAEIVKSNFMLSSELYIGMLAQCSSAIRLKKSA